MRILKQYFKQLNQEEGNIFDVIWCSVRYGASPNNYYEFGFKNLSPSQRATYVTNRFSEKMIRKFNNPKYVDIFEDKTRFAENFSEFFGRKWISTEQLTIDKLQEFTDSIKGDRVIYKPVGNAQGQGIQILDGIHDVKKLFEIINDLNESAIVEEWIQQHPDMSRIYPDAINCLRIITAHSNGKTMFLAGGVTWGNGKQIANASASGFVSPVDFETGILQKPGADFYGHVYKMHPLTGESIVGIKLPFWKETIAMLEKAAAKIPQIGYVGWDVAITPDGPIIIEGNTTPGYKYYQIPIHMIDKCGNKNTYLKAFCM